MAQLTKEQFQDKINKLSEISAEAYNRRYELTDEAVNQKFKRALIEMIINDDIHIDEIELKNHDAEVPNPILFERHPTGESTLTIGFTDKAIQQKFHRRLLGFKETDK